MCQNNENFPQNAISFLRFPIQKFVIIKKNYLIIHSFHLILALMIIGRNALTKKINQMTIFSNFVVIIKYFHTKKLKSFVIEKSKHNVQIMKTFVEINQFYKIKTAHIE